MTTNLDKLIEQQRALQKQIKAAKRAAARRDREALTRARHDLGDRLARSLGGDTPEAIAALGDLLDTDQVRRYVKERLGASGRPEPDAAPHPPKPQTAINSRAQEGESEGGDRGADHR